MYKIELSDGTVLDTLELNGNNYIPKKLNKDIFENNLDEITITDKEDIIEVLYNQKVQFAKIGDVETFISSEITKEEIDMESMIEENKMLNDSVLELAMLMSMVLEGGM